MSPSQPPSPAGPSADRRPRARAGLLVADHEKEGRRLLTVLDRARERVSVLLPWEHAVLVLCDGSRDPEAIAEVVRGGVRAVTLAEVVRCLKWFEREGLIEPAGLRRSAESKPPPGPRTLAGMQAAFREWHADPVRTGRILTGELPEPFPAPPGPAPVDLQPTVSVRDFHVGSTFVVGEDGRAARSLLETSAAPPEADDADEEEATLRGARVAPRPADEATAGDDLDVAALLQAVDSEISAFEEEATQVPPPRARATGGEAVLPAPRDRPARAEKVLTAPPSFAPTVVGRPPDPATRGFDAPTLGGELTGGAFDEDTMLVPGRRRAHEALDTREVESPARRGFDRLARRGAGSLRARLAEASSAEVSALLAHLERLEQLEPRLEPLRSLHQQVRRAAGGEDDAGDADGVFAAAVRALFAAGCCPRCAGPQDEGAPRARCERCEFESP